VQAALENVAPQERAYVERQISKARSEHFVADIVNDVIATAVPVFDARGICATIALISTTSRLGRGPETEQAKLLFETARQLSSELGHADPVWSSAG
jgi:DNA-binding IclR family transcriptional regulator